jgi:MYXO-CTERM domain-containing protein
MSTGVLFLAALLGASPYVRTRTSASHCLWWPGDVITWQQNSAGNTATGAKAFDAVSTSFNTWQQTMTQCGSMTYKEGPRTSSRMVGYDADGPNANVVLFRMSSCTKKVAATAPCWQDGSCGNAFDCWDHASSVLGITIVSFDALTGRVYDADIELNAANNVYTVVDSPVCNHKQSQTCVATDVQNTVTHEIGHLMGLGHATASTSTMNAAAYIGDTNKRMLDSGTKAFICEVYTKSLAPKDCLISASSDVLGPSVEVEAGCASTSGGPGLLWLVAALGLLGRHRRSIAGVAVAAALLASPALATTVVALDLPALTEASDAVVHAQVEKVESRWSADRTSIVTDVHLTVLEPFKGAPAASVVITQPGGVVGRIGQRVEGLASFEPGEELVVFLEARGARFATTGLAQGKFLVDRSTLGGPPVVRQAQAHALFLDAATARPMLLLPLVLPLDALRAQVKAAVDTGAKDAATTAPVTIPN